MAPPAARWLAGQCGCGTARAARVPPARSRVGGGVALDPALDTRPSADADWRRRGRRWPALAGMVSEPVRTSAVRDCPSASWSQLHRRLKEVHIQAHRPIQLGQLAIGALTFETIVANKLSNNGTIPLFDKTLVVLVADPSTRERDLLAGAVGQQFLVDELTAVIRVDPEYWKGEQPACLIERLHHAVLAAVQQCKAFRPGRGDVGQGERVQKRSVGCPTTVSDQVTLEKPRFDVGPLGKRAHWNLMLQQPPWLGRAQPVRLTQWPQQAVHGRWAECEQLCSNVIRDYEVAVALEGGDELG